MFQERVIMVPLFSFHVDLCSLFWCEALEECSRTKVSRDRNYLSQCCFGFLL
jgi:hypothetical protein